jgi:hypothetical protein
MDYEREVSSFLLIFPKLICSALLVHSWRDKIIELLKSPIDAEKDLPATGEDQDVVDPEKEYYAQALKAQGQGKLHQTILLIN